MNISSEQSACELVSTSAMQSTKKVSANGSDNIAAQRQSLPKLGFVGTGWIGRLRMQALLENGTANFGAVYDICDTAAAAAAELAPNIVIAPSLEELLDSDVDGVVIATPSAMHTEQCVQALRGGKAVFCQKPLALTLIDTLRVVETARAVNRLLAVDFSYRHLNGMKRLCELVRSGELGEIFAAELTFHNAYGPDKPWFYDMALAGGGCVMDLGVHLVDLATWVLNRSEVQHLHSSLFHQGKRLQTPCDIVEDYAVINFDLDNTQVQMNCSWNLHAGQDAVIEACFYGTEGSVVLRNVAGSFYDFEVHRFRGTQREKIAGFPDDWGGRALARWVDALSHGSGYDASAESLIPVAEIIDRIYQR